MMDTIRSFVDQLVIAGVAPLDWDVEHGYWFGRFGSIADAQQALSLAQQLSQPYFTGDNELIENELSLGVRYL